MEMITIQLPKEIYDDLVRLNASTIVGDEEGFNAYDDSGGNFDDAYQIGFDDGRVDLAQALIHNIINNGSIDTNV